MREILRDATRLSVRTGGNCRVGSLSGPEMTLSLSTRGLDFGWVTFIAAA